MIEYLSVCSGIEAATVAWHPLGWKPIGFAEIDAFPRAVLQFHYPEVPLHDDFTKLIAEPPAADLLVGGTPCQAFSVAGKRASLEDARGNLSLAFIELANAIDDLRRDRGQAPCIVLWENVPGVFSVSDNAFGCFIAGLVGEDTPIVPPGGKWTDAGLVVGPQRKAAWRTLDAQFFGLAQRRERVFVVASARDGFDPAAVLFEPEGVRRHSAPRREAGERPAGTLGGSSQSGGFRTTDLDNSGAFIPVEGEESADKWPAEITCTLNTMYGDKMGLENQHALNGASMFVPAHLPQVVGALTAKGPEAAGAPKVDGHHYVPMVMSSGQANATIAEDQAPALTCLAEAPVVVQAYSADTVQTLRTRRPAEGGMSADHEHLVAQAFKASHFTRGKDGAPSEVAPPLSADADRGDQDTLVHVVNGNSTPEVATEMAFPLRADDGSGNRQVIAVPIDEVADPLTANSAKTYTHEGTGNFRLSNCVMQPVEPQAYSIMPQNSGKDYKARPVDVAQPLMAGGPVGGNQGGDFIVQPLPFDETQVTHPANRSNPQPGDPSHPLSAHGRPPTIAFDWQAQHAPAIDVDLCGTLVKNQTKAIAFAQNTRDEVRLQGGDGDLAGTLNADSGTHQTTYIAFSAKDYGGDASDDLAPTLRAMPHDGSHANGAGNPKATAQVSIEHSPPLVTARAHAVAWSEEMTPSVDVFGPLQHGGQGGSHAGLMTPTMQVRRLTPTECERLQGFPDYYTAIPWRGKNSTPDGPRYKALGNSMAVPVMRWIGRRIDQALKQGGKP